ncbi:hypothetical protein [Actinomadura geliboluensis]|uniref:Uncharacterized protein n=1 Tax=Actinomadura geliboluensis TaxID=882440 RepID=A0A5S4FZK0_9ACTN|nr:hypothetical protein [Actinomadura geliboluensis]TMR25541.1 hypothetical protein ETD96_42565 [Actinomadura geliboluensis]
MGVDVAQVAAEVTPWVVSAAGAYGGVVLARTQEQAAEATVGWGRRIALQVFGVREEGEPVPEELAGVIDDPDDPGWNAVLRQRIKKMLAADPEFAAELAEATAAMQVKMTFTSRDNSRQYNAPHGTINVNEPDQL